MVSTASAIKLAGEKGFDLVEVAPNANPPVCRLMDYGKFQYRQNKIDQKHRAKQLKHEMKGVRLSIRTSDHDLEVKMRQGEKFLKDGQSLKVVLIFRGREMAHKDLAREKMAKYFEGLKELANKEAEPKVQGYSMTMILHPINS